MDIGTYAESIGFKDISGKGVEENQELKSTSETGSDPAPATPGKKGAEVNQATFVLGCLMEEEDLVAAAGEVTNDQQLMLQTVQEMMNAFLQQQSTVVAQHEMANDVARMDDEALRRFGDGPELVRVKRALMRGGRTEWDVDAAELTKKIFERIADHYQELRQLPQFHLMLERAGMALPPTTTDTARSKEISGKQVKEAPSAADQRKKKKKSAATLPRAVDVPPGLGYLIKELTKSVPDDFRVTVPVSALPEGLLRNHGRVKDADGLRLLIALLMIVKNSRDSTGGKVLRRVLSKELAGLDVRSVATVLSHLRTTPLFKNEFIQQVLNQDLKELSGSVVVWSTCFKTECCALLEEGKGEDTATRATAPSRRSPRRGKARTTATAKTDTETSEKKKSVKRKERGTHGATTRKRKTLHPVQSQNKPRKPDRGEAGC